LGFFFFGGGKGRGSGEKQGNVESWGLKKGLVEPMGGKVRHWYISSEKPGDGKGVGQVGGRKRDMQGGR